VTQRWPPPRAGRIVRISLAICLDVADLSGQLSAALGTTYRIEQELGGGGMSRVFLAEEVGLGRQVVIKVLPPEMAAGVNQDRFRREIQLAARLQHPHIVPLLTAGAAGDLLYYVMPFIKGESLRAKLSRESELPVPEAVRILREVTDALAYAHGEGVVHRDIKPDNVMIAGGHALVTDFGVAKAVSESTGTHSLTSLGMAIGTPAYMAPEQASGDPHVDHRADLYALGAMAFEMLTGRPPFVGGNAQALLAAHVTQAPEHVSQLRPAVPPGLNTVVMRCLEKRAADRWQQARELLPHLDFLMTPSTGGTPPTTAAYPISSGTEAAIRRSHPGRVLALFTLASCGVLGVVWLMVQQFGLPDWVLRGAAVLLVVGLPIMLLTARHERQMAIARTTNARVAAPTGVQTLFTWRKALTGGAVAFAGLGVLTIVYVAMKLLGIGAVGTLLAKGALSERDRIVLAEFENRTSDTTLGSTVTELLRTDLSQSRSVSVYDVAQLSEVVQRMQLPRGSRITFDVAKDAATREGLKAVLAGDISQLGSGYILSARLVATSSGDVLWAGRENATAADLAAAIDRLSATLRERIGESLKSIRGDPPLDQMTTSSTEALRMFVQAERANDRGDREGAIGLLERALAQDSNFAMAHRRLGVMLRNVGRDSARSTAALTRAYELRDRLSVRERYQAEATYHSNVARDTAKAIAAYRALLDRYPDDRVAGNNLGLLYRQMGNNAEALKTYRAAIRYGNASSTTFLNAMNVVAELEPVDSAMRLVEAFIATYPDNPDAVRLRSQVLMRAELLDSARVVLEQQRATTRGNDRVQTNVLFSLGQIAGAQGRVRDLEVLFREARTLEARAFPQNVPPGVSASEYVESEMLQLRSDIALGTHADTATAVRLLNESYRIVPVERRARSIPSLYLNAARLYALAQRPNEAQRLWRQWEAAVTDSVRTNLDAGALSVRADIARSEKRYDDALRDARASREKTPGCVGCQLGLFARAYFEAGRADSAIVYYEKLIELPGLGVRGGGDLFERLAQLYERVGDTANAIKYYTKVTERWAKADSVLQPHVQAARERIAALR
jgi:serine/threonine protein kinase/tetratricopeptide (TPR) repeat protein/TolB-like protein